MSESSTRASWIGGAISTASSPLRTGFLEINCRSPVTPRRSSRYSHDGAKPRHSGLYLNVERSKYSANHISPYTPTPRSIGSTSPVKLYSAQREDSDHEDETRSSIELVSSTAASQIIPPTPHFLYPYIDEDEGKLGTFSAINIIIGKTVGVGVYSVPSSIFVGVGSVGMSILVWILGAIISFCGLAVYLELGTAIPRSGGERVYLERIFRRPRMLATCMYGVYVVLLGFSTPNCIVLGEYVMYAVNLEPNRWNVRLLAVSVITLLCVVHARLPKLGLRIINILGVSKMVILVLVILAGVAALISGVGSQEHLIATRRLGTATELAPTFNELSTAERNFSNIWEGSSTQPYDYATALLKVLYCFRGYSTANQVLSSIRSPIPTLKKSAPIALGLVSAGYILANIAYFLAVEKEDFKRSGVVVAGHFFKNVFGVTVGERVLPCFVVISAFGNIAATSFAQARVNQELGKDGLLPFAKFWQVSPSKKQGEQVPISGLLLHWLVSVLVIVIPPPGHIYNFLVEIGGYPVSIISVAISLGLLYLQSTPSEHWESPFRARKVYIIIFAASNMFLLILPWIKPSRDKGTGGFPYYAYPATSVAILGTGVLYWGWWALIKPLTLKSGGRAWVKGHKINGSDLSYPGERALMLMNYERDSEGAGSENGGEIDGIQDLEGTSGTELGMKQQVSEAQNGVRRRAPCGCPLNHGAQLAKPT